MKHLYLQRMQKCQDEDQLQKVFRPVEPIVVLVYQSLTLLIAMLSLVTVSMVTVRSLTAPVPRPAAATVTVSAATYPVPPATMVVAVTAPLTSMVTFSLRPVPLPPVGSTVCTPACDPRPVYAPAVTAVTTPSPGSSKISAVVRRVVGSVRITPNSRVAAFQE